jgi:diaminopimelate epimerase
MELNFSKWHGTGNDFILVDDRAAVFPVDRPDLVRQLCLHHFGIGSDGLILVQGPRDASSDFHMEFFNPDASKSFCGNGSRCAFAFWSALNGTRSSARFTAIDGDHLGEWVGEDVCVTLPPVQVVESGTDGKEVDFIHTGSPHMLVWVDDVDAVDINTDAPPRRRSVRHGSGGTNVNYLQRFGRGLRMRTFERGVEAETLSCGSGVVAAALSALHRSICKAPVEVGTRGGQLHVEARMDAQGGFDGLRLTGPVRFVFQGTVLLSP